MLFSSDLPIKFSWQQAAKFVLSYDGANPASLWLLMHFICWDIDIVHHTDAQLVNADYCSRQGVEWIWPIATQLPRIFDEDTHHKPVAYRVTYAFYQHALLPQSKISSNRRSHQCYQRVSCSNNPDQHCCTSWFWLHTSVTHARPFQATNW